ncbi:MAG: hypothetical protein AAB433_06485 [Nitrospirota bacterium]
MKENSNDVNDISLYLSALACSAAIKEELWRSFGYKRRPRHGKFFLRFLNKEKLAVENFILREATALAFIDVLAGIKQNVASQDDRVLLLVGTSLHLCTTMDQVFENEKYLEYLKASIHEYRHRPNLPSTFVKRAGAHFEIKKFPKFLAGVVRLIALHVSSSSPGVKGFLLDQAFLKSYLADKSPLVGTIDVAVDKGTSEEHIRFFMDEACEGIS